MAKSLALLLGVAAIAIAHPASAQLRPAPLDEIYEAYNDCFEVATLGGFEPSAVEKLGWKRARVQSEGEAVDTPLAIYSHKSRRPLIMLSSDPDDGMCVVTARLEDAGKFEEFKQAWAGNLPEPDAEGVIFFNAEGRVVRLAQTGTPAAPGLSIAVMAPTEN